MDKETLRSTHIFILPFKIEETSRDKNRRKEKILKNLDEWEEYEIESDYNVDCYLTKYAKDALSKYGNDANDSYVGEYHNTKISGGNFTFEIKHEGEEKEVYELKLKEVKVKFFDTSVGTLSFVLENHEYKNLKEILDINNFGRMLYTGFNDEKNKYYQILKEGGEEVASIEITMRTGKLSNKIVSYFLKTDDLEFVEDDRMYTISHFLDENLCSGKIYETLDYKERWYNHIFIDKYYDDNCPDKELRTELVKRATYTRWSGYNTLYGISRYSFVLWSDNGKFNRETINMHIEKIYFQLVSLAIAEKVSLVKLNERMARVLESMTKADGEDEEYTESYIEYLNYISKLDNSEITLQEQGIELYDMCRSQMTIEKLSKELNLKIKTLAEKAERIADKRAYEQSKLQEEAERKADKQQEKLIFKLGIFIAMFELLSGVIGWEDETVGGHFIKEFSKFFVKGDGETWRWIPFIVFLIIVTVIVCYSRKLYKNIEKGEEYDKGKQMD